MTWYDIEGHQFLTINCMGTIEISSKMLDLDAYVNRTKPTKNREKCHFIRIGGMRYMQCKGRRCGRHTAWKDELSQHCSQDSIFHWLSGPRRQGWLRMKFLNLDSPSRLDCALRSGSPVKYCLCLKPVISSEKVYAFWPLHSKRSTSAWLTWSDIVLT